MFKADIFHFFIGSYALNEREQLSFFHSDMGFHFFFNSVEGFDGMWLIQYQSFYSSMFSNSFVCKFVFRTKDWKNIFLFNIEMMGDLLMPSIDQEVADTVRVDV